MNPAMIPMILQTFSAMGGFQGSGMLTPQPQPQKPQQQPMPSIGELLFQQERITDPQQLKAPSQPFNFPGGF